MCGIVGYWDAKGAEISIVEKMTGQMKHRGPDDRGSWRNKKGDITFGHRRLSIVDLSPAGHQPMHSPCGRFTLIYNGEIYNAKDLRLDLEGEGGNFNWCGHSDTEVLLAALMHWGVENALSKLNGMFAFALWDDFERTLLLARDRVGEKPLYYGLSSSTFMFCSELKSLVVHPEWRGEIDRDALALYLRYNYVPAPFSIYQGIKKLPPAHYVVVRDVGRSVTEPICYWNLGSIAEQANSFEQIEEEDAILELEALLSNAVFRRMNADVPLGAFLSGGYDSTMIVALMQAQSRKPIKTFTIGFYEKGYNEAIYAKNVAKHLGTDHTELYVTSKHAMDVIPKLSLIWDEPFSDSSQIPFLLVSELAKKYVTVSLSGDGGDELFYGYKRYLRGQQIWSKLDNIPLSIRKILACGLRAVSGRTVEKFFRFLPKTWQIAYLADRLPKLADIINKDSGESFYHRLVSNWSAQRLDVHPYVEPSTIFDNKDFLLRLPSLSERMMYIDTMTYLPDDILTKVDRASMAVGLESRVPFLDHRVVEFSWKIPMSMKYRDRNGKWLLRQLLNRYVPRQLMERPKMGFGIPIDDWLRGPLREWGEELLKEDRIRQEGFLDHLTVRKMWCEHISGKRRWHYTMWNLLMFQAWLELQ